MVPVVGSDRNSFARIQVFFGVGRKIESSNLEIVLSTEGPYMPSMFLPFACTEGYDLLCFDLRGHEEKVVFWDRAPSWGNDIWREADLYPIAPDFGAFLDLLGEYQG